MKETHIDKVYSYMMNHGEISQREAYKMGVYRLSAVIWVMKRDRGMLIKTDMREVINKDGSKSRVGFYSLVNNDPKQVRMDI